MKNIKKILLMSLLLAGFSGSVSYADSQENSLIKHHHHIIRTKATQNTPVDINQADLSQLETLVGLGAKKSQAILDYRKANGPFHNVTELSKVKGIGAKMVARLQAKNPGRILVNSK